MLRSNRKSSIAIPHFTSTKLSKCIICRKYQDSVSVFRSFISYEELISARRLLPLLRLKTISSKRRLVKKIDLTISNKCCTRLFFFDQTSHLTERCIGQKSYATNWLYRPNGFQRIVVHPLWCSHIIKWYKN